MSEEGAPYFPVKGLLAPYPTKPEGNIRLRLRTVKRVNPSRLGAGTLL
jgi:hypothetical protein